MIFRLNIIIPFLNLSTLYAADDTKVSQHKNINTLTHISPASLLGADKKHAFSIFAASTLWAPYNNATT